MIFGHIHNELEFALLPSVFQAALSYLKSVDPLAMTPGVYGIPGYAKEDVYAMVMDLQTIPLQERPPEVHQKYIDLQYAPQGCEAIGVAADLGENTLRPGLSAQEMEEKDILFYENSLHESTLHLSPGSYAIFFPWDVHRPACCEAAPALVRKLVLKISMHLVFP